MSGICEENVVARILLRFQNNVSLTSCLVNHAYIAWTIADSSARPVTRDRRPCSDFVTADTGNCKNSNFERLARSLE